MAIDRCYLQSKGIQIIIFNYYCFDKFKKHVMFIETKLRRLCNMRPQTSRQERRSVLRYFCFRSIQDTTAREEVQQECCSMGTQARGILQQL